MKKGIMFIGVIISLCHISCSIFNEHCINVINETALYKKPSSKSKKIKFIKEGEILEILEYGNKDVIDNVNGQWVKVKIGSKKGWCIDSYLFPILNYEDYLTVKSKKKSDRVEDIFEYNFYGINMLIDAVSDEESVKIKLLLEAGGDINTYGLNRDSLLITAVKKNNINLVKFLIDNGVEINSKNNDCRTALYFAEENNYNEIAQLLLKNGAVIYEKRSVNMDLMNAVIDNDLLKINNLLENGFNLNESTNFGLTALMWASDLGYKQIARLLIAKGANVNAQTDEGMTALIIASKRNRHPRFDSENIEKERQNIESGYQEIIKMLIENGADVNKQNKKGWTALMYASNIGYKERVNILVKEGADLNLKNGKDETALIRAIRKDNKDIVELLRAEG